MLPGAPTGIMASASDATANLAWTAPSFTGASAITSYTITPYVGSTAGTPTVVAAPATNANITGLLNGTTYWFTIAATNSAGTGPPAASYSVTPTSALAPPARMTASSTLQYQLPNSDGVTWQDIDANNLSLSFTPAADGVAIVSGNADLWTADAGYNQDIGIWAQVAGSFRGGIEAWKESGGFAGTFSPNAAEVQAAFNVTASSTYSVKLVWKTNMPALGASIYAGAGPISGQFSPTRLTVRLVPSTNVAYAISWQQFVLANNNGTAWSTLDNTNFQATLKPTADGTAIVSANADLWTADAGINQDIGVMVSVNGGPDQLVAWKESGGFAGTFSPNAAFLQATYPVSSGSTYVFTLEWKPNIYAIGKTIYAGAGPIDGLFSPTSLTVFEEPTSSIAAPGTMARQYSLAGSDGATWQNIDLTTLETTITPTNTASYVLSGNADLWTANAGFNQDFGIMISGGAFGAGQLVAWKESGGFGGTLSPNAAYVETVQTLDASTTYTVWLVWKTNLPAPGATIYAAAGPIPLCCFSSTRLAVIPQ
jgi:hypothetical protein